MTDYSADTPVGRLDPAARRADVGTPDGATRSLGDVIGDLMKDVSTLVQQEVELAKAELRQSASRAGQGVGMFAGAAVAGFLFVLFLSIALWWAIGDHIGLGWAAVVVAVIWLVATVVLVLVGRTEMKKITGLAQTTETLEKVPNAIKGHEERNR